MHRVETRLSHRILRGVLILFVPPTVLAVGVLVLLYSLGVHHHPAAMLIAVVIGAAAMVTYLAFMIQAMGESLAAAIREMQLDTEVMATADPSHRLHVLTGDELEALAAAINRLGEALCAARSQAGAAHAPGQPEPVEVHEPEKPAFDRRLIDVDAVALDVETTGMDRDGQDRIISLAGVRVCGGALSSGETFQAMVNPGRSIPASSSACHGMTDACVAQAPFIDTILPAFVDFTSGAVLVGHQVWFDLHFLDREARRLGLAPLQEGRPILDTAVLAPAVDPALAEVGLDGIASRLGVTVQGRHSALGDAQTTAEIYVRLVRLLAARGIVTVGQVLEATGAKRQ